jgi:hypothetical protein
MWVALSIAQKPIGGNELVLSIGGENSDRTVAKRS